MPLNCGLISNLSHREDNDYLSRPMKALIEPKLVAWLQFRRPRTLILYGNRLFLRTNEQVGDVALTQITGMAVRDAYSPLPGRFSRLTIHGRQGAVRLVPWALLAHSEQTQEMFQLIVNSLGRKLAKELHGIRACLKQIEQSFVDKQLAQRGAAIGPSSWLVECWRPTFEDISRRFPGLVKHRLLPESEKSMVSEILDQLNRIGPYFRLAIPLTAPRTAHIAHLPVRARKPTENAARR
jgi:hypothetical protein